MIRRAALLPLISLAGCDLSMTEQAKHQPQSSPTLWNGGPAEGPSPDGTIAQDQPARTTAEANPPPMSLALVQRGRERFTIFCAPCHGASGAGNGIIVGRGFPHPPSYYSRQVEALSPAQIVGVITHGYGVMYSFDERVEPADRWAIASYVKALQRAHDRAGPQP